MRRQSRRLRFCRILELDRQGSRRRASRCGRCGGRHFRLQRRRGAVPYRPCPENGLQGLSAAFSGRRGQDRARSVTVHSNGLGEGGRVLCPYDNLSDAVKLCTMFDNAEDRGGMGGNLRRPDQPGAAERHHRPSRQLPPPHPHGRRADPAHRLPVFEGAVRCVPHAAQRGQPVRPYPRLRRPVRPHPCGGRAGPSRAGHREIRYPAVFAALEQAGYRGLIGYELFPKTDTKTAVRAIMAD